MNGEKRVTARRWSPTVRAVHRIRRWVPALAAVVSIVVNVLMVQDRWPG